MLKRLRWLILGALLGVVAYLWVREKARQMPSRAVDAAAERGSEFAQSAATRGRDFGSRLKEALREGREAMHAKEAELRAELGHTHNGQGA